MKATHINKCQIHNREHTWPPKHLCWCWRNWWCLWRGAWSQIATPSHWHRHPIGAPLFRSSHYSPTRRVHTHLPKNTDIFRDDYRTILKLQQPQKVTFKNCMNVTAFDTKYQTIPKWNYIWCCLVINHKTTDTLFRNTPDVSGAKKDNRTHHNQ